MDFYGAQDQAKRKTKYLVLFYVMMLLLLTFLATLILIMLLPVFGVQSQQPLSWQYFINQQNQQMLLGVGAFVFAGALISSYIKSRQLSKGGAAVAASIGAVKISPNSRNFNERKALNVVEEMAIASGMPVPEVYLLKDENGINAFAAGLTPSDAVIGMTQGCIDRLTREQLQGVVGHEFSHILNGDMRLNLRIIMLLHGVEFIGMLGRVLTSSQRRNRSSFSSSRSRNKSNGAIVLAGLALRLLGWFGVMAGNLVQAAVSRQREFLADASAVQFTRNPDSIADALKVIGAPLQSSKLRNTDVNEMAHMFFSQAFATKMQFLFATHPPLQERIRRIEPRWDGLYLQGLEPPLPAEAEPQQDVQNSQQDAQQNPQQQMLAMLLATGVAVEALEQKQQQQLADLAVNAQDPMEAMALVVAVLLLEDKATNANEQAFQKSWQKTVNNSEIAGLAELINKQLQLLGQIDMTTRLPMIELSMPALKEMSTEQYQRYKKLLQDVMAMDGQQSVFEQSVFQLVTRFLDRHFGLAKPIKVKYRKAKQVAIELQLLFSVLAYYGDSNHAQAERAFLAAMHKLMLPELNLLKVSEQENQLFQKTVEKLIYCDDLLKQKIVEALIACVEHDAVVNQVEREMVLAIAATIDAPIPRINIHN